MPGQGEGHLRLRGSGSTEAFELADLQLALLDGTLAGQGRLRWSPALAGDITLTGEGLDPSPLLPDYPGDLRLEVRASGSRSGDGLNARIEPLSVVGSLRDRPLALRVTADVADSAVAIEEFDLEAGESRVDLRGTLAGDSLDLKWHIDSGDLGDLLPEASGSLAGSGTVSGSTALPAVRGTADGNAMRFADFALDRVALEIDVDLESTSPSRIDLTADGARLGDATIAHAALTGAGTRHDHTLRIGP